jgi:hypothetical protein
LGADVLVEVIAVEELVSVIGPSLPGVAQAVAILASPLIVVTMVAVLLADTGSGIVVATDGYW